MISDIYVYLLLGLSSFFFVVVPVSGSFVLNPLLALIVDPHAAVSVAAFFFLLNSTIKAYIFRADIRVEYVKKMLPLSLIAAPFGAWLVAYIPARILLIIIFLFTLYFLAKTLNDLFRSKPKSAKSGSSTLVATSIFSGFLQGTGLGAGGSLRKAYFFSEKLTLAEMNGTASMISIFLLIVSVLVRLYTNQVSLETLTPILYLLPIMALATWAGRSFLKRINERASNIIVVVTMLVITISLGIKIF